MDSSAWKALGLDLYDPRRGEDWSFELSRHERFSSLRHRLLVLDSRPKEHLGGLFATFPPVLDLGDLGDMLGERIAATGRRGFVISDPAPPGLSELARGPAARAAASACAIFDPAGGAIDKILALRGPARGDQLWILGSCNEELATVERNSWRRDDRYDFTFVLREIDKIGCFFSQEGNQVTIMLPACAAIDSVLEGIGSRVRGRAEPPAPGR